MDVSTVTDSLAADYRTLTEQVGLVDRSERGKLALTGGEAKEFLHGQVSQDIESLTPGHGAYAVFLTHKGKMLGDLRVLDLGDELWLDTERVALQELFNMIRRYKLGRDVELHKRTVERSLLSLVGPGARDLLAVGPAEHDNARTELGIAVATDVGVDLICDAERTDEVKAALGVPEVGEAVAEIVRVEHGRPRFGIELDDSVIPQEAGLNERAVSFTKGCYVGQETVARLHYRGKPNRHLRGLRLSEPVATGEPLRLGEREVGRVGTSVVSPAHGPIALALVRREAAPGDTVDRRRRRGGDGQTLELPFLLRWHRRRARGADVDPAGQRGVVLHALRLDEHEAGHRLAAGAAELVHVRLAARGLRLLRFDAHHELRLAHHPFWGQTRRQQRLGRSRGSPSQQPANAARSRHSDHRGDIRGAAAVGPIASMPAVGPPVAYLGGIETPRAPRRRRTSGPARRRPPRPPARRARSRSSACGRGGRIRARVARGTRLLSPQVRCAPPVPSRASRRPPCCRRPSIPRRRTSFVRPHPGAPPSAP